MEAQTTKKPKFNILNFIKQQGKKTKINLDSHEIYCLCTSRNNKKVQCVVCKEDYHQCVKKDIDIKDFECLRCINKYLDPLFTVRKVFVQTFVVTTDIFQHQNVFRMIFYIQSEDLAYPVEVRGLMPNKRQLSWPMQGSFYLNEQDTSIFQLKPLIINSNRKNRKQDYFFIPKQKLRIGKNTLTYRIPCLNQKFAQIYKSQKEGSYYFSINSIKKLKQQQLVDQIKKNKASRLQKPQSIKFLQETLTGDGELLMNGIKICLNCPYTSMRIKTPVRGKNCKHFSCVCLETLILTHQKLRFWNCPVCKQRLNQPKVDIWILQILNDNQSGSEVRFNLNGQYFWTSQNLLLSDFSDSENSPINRTIKHKQEQQQGQRQNQLQIIQQQINQPIIELDQSKSEHENQMVPQGKGSISLDIKKPKEKNNQPQRNNILIQNEKEKQEKSLPLPQKVIFYHPPTFITPFSQNIKEKMFQNKVKFKNELKKASISPSQATMRHIINKQAITQNAIIYDIKILKFKQIGLGDFRHHYFKLSPKKKVPDELKKIFKEVL